MLDFHTPTLADKPWVDEVLTRSRHIGSTYTFAQIYLWSGFYDTKIARLGNSIVCRTGRLCGCYIYPAGEYDIVEAVGELKRHSAGCTNRFVFCAAEEWQADELDTAFPGRFEREETRNDFDYIYNADDLINLAGRKYHGKRNHISRFTREHPDWRYEPLTDENTADCALAAEAWYAAPENAGEGSLSAEREIIARALREREQLRLRGGLIRCDGKVIAFTMGERLNADTFDVHFEKALPGYDEAYTVINNAFAKNELGGYRYINREEDVGMEGLRTAKLSYQPVLLLRKFNMFER